MHPMTRFWKDRGGNFGVMTALLLVPLIGTAGMALDFGHALTVKQQLVGAADAAAVGAIAEKSKAVAQAMQLPGDGSVALDPAEARSIFLGQMFGELASLPVSVDIQVAKNNGILTSHVAFSATLPTTFMTILGKDDITVSGQATAQYQTPSFLDFYMLLDNTPSMGSGRRLQTSPSSGQPPSMVAMEKTRIAPSPATSSRKAASRTRTAITTSPKRSEQRSGSTWSPMRSPR